MLSFYTPGPRQKQFGQSEKGSRGSKMTMLLAEYTHVSVEKYFVITTKWIYLICFVWFLEELF